MRPAVKNPGMPAAAGNGYRGDWKRNTAVSWSKAKRKENQGEICDHKSHISLAPARKAIKALGDVSRFPLSAVFFPLLQLTAPIPFPTIPMSGSGSLLHQIGNNAHEGWQVIYQITFQYILRRESIRLSRCMLYVPSWAVSFALALLRKRAAFSPPPLLPGGIPHHISDRRPSCHHFSYQFYRIVEEIKKLTDFIFCIRMTFVTNL